MSTAGTVIPFGPRRGRASVQGADGRPEVLPERTIASLGRLAERVRLRTDRGDSHESVVGRLHDVLYRELGFRPPDAASFHDPGNSRLDLVVRRRVGLPISLAIVELEVAWRIGLRLWGIGLPGHFINAGHDLRMPRNAQHVFHAIALDESRAFFPLTRLSSLGKPDDARLTEVWFRGVHSDVGGGNGNATLNWIALQWMFQNALRCGLPIDPAAVQANLARRVDPPRINDHSIDAQIPRHCRAGDILHVSVTLNEGEPGRPHNNPSVQVRRIDDDGVFA